MKGELPLFEKAKALQEELMMLMPEEPGDGVLDQEKYLLKNAKKIALLIAGLAAQKYGKAIDNEQEILCARNDQAVDFICAFKNPVDS